MSGARAHTARPYTGRNAIHRLGQVITKVASYEPRTATIDGIDFIEQLQVVDVDGGVAPNVVPDRASARSTTGWRPIGRRRRPKRGWSRSSVTSLKRVTE